MATDILKEISELQKAVKILQQGNGAVNLAVKTSFLVPRLAADPASPTDGMVWLNTTSDELKARINGATVVVTVT